MNTENQIIATLRNSELSGLDIAKKLNIDVGLLYPYLHSLEKQGLIESRYGEKQAEERLGLRKRYYKLTDAGNRIETVQNSVDNFGLA